ncbi:WXG100 family type VII secretion target [Streptomyces sp. NPDC005438]|uniref:WXG100 family type VII secretion target n=1 Tax=Streptomyces sp. NPDC005438 TaxID=3156880 RepID=UPI0033B121B0
MAVQKVNGVSLKKLEGELEAKFHAFRARVATLQRVIDAQEGRWQGVGASAFNHKQMMINQDVQALAKMLDGFKNSIHDTRTLSGNTDDDVLQRMNGISVDGGLSSNTSAGDSSTQGSLASKLDRY